MTLVDTVRTTGLFGNIVAKAALGILFGLVVGMCAAPSSASDSTEGAGSTPTCSVEIGHGFRLQIPSQLFDRDCKNSAVVFPGPGLVLQFPDKSRARWLGLGDRMAAQSAGIHLSKADPFPVKIKYIWIPPWPAPYPQVWQMKEQQFTDGTLMGWSNETRIVPSSIKPLRQLSFFKRDKTPFPYQSHGQVYDRSLGRLIEPEGADYDLWMDCDEAVECEGYVQLRRNKLQYHFLMPYESASHAGEVVAWINQMISDWLAR